MSEKFDKLDETFDNEISKKEDIIVRAFEDTALGINIPYTLEVRLFEQESLPAMMDATTMTFRFNMDWLVRNDEMQVSAVAYQMARHAYQLEQVYRLNHGGDLNEDEAQVMLWEGEFQDPNEPEVIEADFDNHYKRDTVTDAIAYAQLRVTREFKKAPVLPAAVKNAVSKRMEAIRSFVDSIYAVS